jgi:chromosome segregation ATPase
MARLIFAPLFLACTLTPPSTAQSPDSPSLQALVSEIHQLRLAIERTGAATPKIQITLQRLQLQEQRATRISDQLADLRKQITGLSGRNNLVIAVQDLNTKIAQEQDATRKKAIELELHQINAMVEEQGRMVQQLRVQEAELAASLRLEQAKADELSDHLAALERSLDPPPAK